MTRNGSRTNLHDEFEVVSDGGVHVVHVELHVAFGAGHLFLDEGQVSLLAPQHRVDALGETALHDRRDTLLPEHALARRGEMLKFVLDRNNTMFNVHTAGWVIHLYEI